jgi:hypothetical protein
VSLQSDKNTYRRMLFMTISAYILLRMRNVLDKSCRESQNMLFPESRAIYVIMWGKYGRASQAADHDIIPHHVLCLLNN